MNVNITLPTMITWAGRMMRRRPSPSRGEPALVAVVIGESSGQAMQKQQSLYEEMNNANCCLSEGGTARKITRRRNSDGRSWFVSDGAWPPDGAASTPWTAWWLFSVSVGGAHGVRLHGACPCNRRCSWLDRGSVPM